MARTARPPKEREPYWVTFTFDRWQWDLLGKLFAKEDQCNGLEVCLTKWLSELMWKTLREEPEFEQVFAETKAAYRAWKAKEADLGQFAVLRGS